MPDGRNELVPVVLRSGSMEVDEFVEAFAAEALEGL